MLRKQTAKHGLKAVAKSFRVSPGTISRWLKTGVPSQRKHDVKVYVSRVVAGQKAARTKKILDRRLKQPPSPAFKYKPKSGLGIQRSVPKSQPKKPGFYPDTTTVGKFKEVAERWWIIDKEIVDIDFDKEISEPVIAWRDATNRKAYVHIYFEMVRYIPFNPAYRGELVKKQGTWVPEYPISTSYELMPDSIKRAVHFALHKRYNYGQTRHLMLLRFKAGLKERRDTNVGKKRKNAPKKSGHSKSPKKKTISRVERGKRKNKR